MVLSVLNICFAGSRTTSSCITLLSGPLVELCHCHSYVIPCIYVAGLLQAGCWLSPVCVLSCFGNLWGDKDFWYIIVCYVYVDSMFVSGGGGGGGGSTNLWWTRCLFIVISVFREIRCRAVRRVVTLRPFVGSTIVLRGVVQ